MVPLAANSKDNQNNVHHTDRNRSPRSRLPCRKAADDAGILSADAKRPHAACNQKSNRDPVMYLDETSILTASTACVTGIWSMFFTAARAACRNTNTCCRAFMSLSRRTCCDCVLLLRGRRRSANSRALGTALRIFGLDEVQETLDGLTRREDPLVVKLERQPGQKEAGYAHLLCGEVDLEAQVAVRPPRTESGGSSDRIEKLEQEVERLTKELSSFRETFDEFRKQFD